jgi:MFS family permease
MNYKFKPEHVTVINAGTIVFLQVFVSWITKKRKALPTMMAGMFIGSLGFLCLALSSNAWVFILGIAVFSIGEMTCHPKYVSYIGLIAPSDKKATYMGYAFIYGVIGSLVGSNVGGELYEKFLTPLVNKSSGAGSTLTMFWLSFAILGIFSMGGLFLFNRYLGKNTVKTRNKAKKIMAIGYISFIVIGILFIGTNFSNALSQYGISKLGFVFMQNAKTILQSIILIAIGSLGIYMSSKKQYE